MDTETLKAMADRLCGFMAQKIREEIGDETN